MRLDVAFTPLGLPAGDLAGRTVAVIDVLRASTSICAALHHGARAVIVAEDPAEATRIEQAVDSTDVLLAGERNSQRIPGFALGNSPGEMTADAVRGKTLIMSTTNGTVALLAAAGAREVVVAAAVNLTAAGDHLRTVFERDRDILILCAGRERGFGLDDAYIAGRLAVAAMGGRRLRRGLNDAALVAVDLVRRYGSRVDRVLALSAAGRSLAALGMRQDVEYAARVDAHPVLPLFRDQRVTLPVAR